MESGDTMILAYWKIRSLLVHVQKVAEVAGVKYELKFFEAGGPPDFDRSCWFDVKDSLGVDFPNLPYIIDGDHQMSETLPIIEYVCHKGKPELLGETPAEKAKVSEVGHILHDIKQSCTLECYKTDDKEHVLNMALLKLEPISKYLGDKKFFLGDKYFWPDIYIHEFIELVQAVVDEENVLEKKYPNLIALHDRVSEIDEIKAFLESDRNIKMPFNNTMAKINAE